MFRRKVAEGIELRQFAAEDAAVLLPLIEQNRPYLREWLPWVDHTHSLADLRQFIARAQAQFEAGLGPNAGIWLDGVLAGAIGCHAFDLANRSCSLGYYIAASEQGRGTITRCCASLLEYVFGEAGLHRVEIRCGTGNRRSSAIPRRLGFHHEGILRQAEWVNDHWVDLEIWSMLQPDWHPGSHA